MPEYSFKANRLILKDVHHDIDEPFSPLMLPENPKHGTLLSDGSLLLLRQGEISIENKGVRTGQFKILYPSGKLKMESYYLEGVLHGPSTFISEEGQVLSTSWYYRGKKEGEFLLWYLSGALYSRQQFLNGLWEGKQEYYHPDGRPKNSIIYQQGRLIKSQSEVR